MTMQQDLLFAFGLGYSAEVLAHGLIAKGWAVAGTVRSAENATALNKRGITAQAMDTSAVPDIPGGAHWLISVPPTEDGCPILPGASAHVAGAASVTYLSTTGVYGDLAGGWAFEWTTLNPTSPRAQNRALAERQWTELCARSGTPLRLVRLPGIYGPERSPFARIRSGVAQSIIKPGQVFSRVHVGDIATGLEAMMARPEAAGIFHLCDDAPARPQDVTSFAASLLGMPAPKQVDFASAELSPMARSFYAECKRVSNARAKSALGWAPAYKTYRAGLRAVLAAEMVT